MNIPHLLAFTSFQAEAPPTPGDSPASSVFMGRSRVSIPYMVNQVKRKSTTWVAWCDPRHCQEVPLPWCCINLEHLCSHRVLCWCRMAKMCCLVMKHRKAFVFRAAGCLSWGLCWSPVLRTCLCWALPSFFSAWGLLCMSRVCCRSMRAFKACWHEWFQPWSYPCMGSEKARSAKLLKVCWRA